MAHEVPVTQARAELAELFNRVVYAGERVVVTRHGKPLVALVSAADLRRLEEIERADEERVITTVSVVGAAASAAGERRHQFGIAARRPAGAVRRGEEPPGGR